jgi:di/tricarboxylate transporter
VLEGVAVRTGVYVGVSLSVIFTAWLIIANRMPMLESLAVPRNLAAACFLALFGCLPVVRFFRSPSEMLLSSMLGWGLFTLTYGVWCLKFTMLDQYYSTFQVFVLGAIVYLLLATLCWIGTIIWRVRATHSSHPRH